MKNSKIKSSSLILSLLIFILVIIIFYSLSGLYIDYLWFKEIQLESLLLIPLYYNVIYSAIIILLNFTIVYLVLHYLSQKLIKKDEFDPEKVKCVKRMILILFALFLIFILFYDLANNNDGPYREYLFYKNSTSFGINDPILGKDLSFYLFKFPFMEMIFNEILSIPFGTIFYLLLASLALVKFSKGILLKKILDFDKRVIIFLLSIYLFFYAVKIYFLGIPSILFSEHFGNDIIASGPNVTDIAIKLPYLKILAILLLVLSIRLIVSILINKGNEEKYLSLSKYSLFVLIGSIVLGWMATGLYNSLIVKPNELDKEKNYIAHHLDSTRRAWGLDQIKESKLEGKNELTWTDIEKNQSTFQNIRLWNRDQLLEVFNQTQSLRSYYNFISVDDDRYFIDGSYRQVMLSARELNLADLSSSSFINNKIIYTHGIGIVATPVVEVSTEGSPLYISKDIPPKGSLVIQKPQIYFGEGNYDNILVNTNTDELDYPSGENNIYSQYQGKAGIAFNSFLRKLLFTTNFNDLNLLFTKQTNNQTKIVLNRNIISRVKKAFGFLSLDEDFYLVVDGNGGLKWMGDGYTESRYYPYSKFNQEGINYLRNSVKFVIDAYDGEITAYIVDKDDPIINTYSKIFPDVFKSIEVMDPSLRMHLRYPSYLFASQAQMYSTYHMKDTKIYYNKEDRWEIPQEGEELSMRHFIMKLPTKEKEEFVFVVPFTPAGKSNLVNWLAVSNDGVNYGRINSYTLSKQTVVYGPEQIKAKISQDPLISQQITLWDQKGSRVVKGSLFIIPIEDSFIYVQPLYLYATEEQSIPELRTVIMVYQDKIVMGKNVSDSLAKLFDKEKTTLLNSEISTTVATENIPELINQLNDYYEKSQTALKEGNWKSYGEYIAKVEEVLTKLKER